jgi:hypothetical protein
MPTAGFTRRRPQPTREGSLSELEALARDAAHGAGLAWGLAEEAGFAVRWLAARQLPGPALAAGWLERRAELDPAGLAPSGGRGVWLARGERLCPFVAGATIADRGESEIVLGPVAAPLLLAPFAALAARDRGGGLELAWEGALVCLAVDAEGWRAEGPSLPAEEAAGVSLHPASAAVQPGRPKPKRPELPVTLWQRLDALAARTRARGDDDGEAG